VTGIREKSEFPNIVMLDGNPFESNFWIAADRRDDIKPRQSENLLESNMKLLTGFLGSNSSKSPLPHLLTRRDCSSLPRTL